jgi:type I restriction enzyme M protein
MKPEFPSLGASSMLRLRYVGVSSKKGGNVANKNGTRGAVTEDSDLEQDGDGDVILEGQLVCALTGEQYAATPQEETLQSFVEQLHREYGIPIENMARDIKISCVSEEGGKQRNRTRTISIGVYAGKGRDAAGIVRAVIVAKPGSKSDKKAIDVLDEVLGNLSPDREQVFGVWTNGTELAFRMRTFNTRTGEPEFTDLTDIPAPDETLEELETADRRPLRVASGDSLLRSFKRCHDYLYGNQNMRGDRAFWQILYLIFAKILDERSSRRGCGVPASMNSPRLRFDRAGASGRKKFNAVCDFTTPALPREATIPAAFHYV